MMGTIKVEDRTLHLIQQQRIVAYKKGKDDFAERLIEKLDAEPIQSKRKYVVDTVKDYIHEILCEEIPTDV